MWLKAAWVGVREREVQGLAYRVGAGFGCVRPQRGAKAS